MRALCSLEQYVSRAFIRDGMTRGKFLPVCRAFGFYYRYTADIQKRDTRYQSIIKKKKQKRVNI